MNMLRRLVFVLVVFMGAQNLYAAGKPAEDRVKFAWAKSRLFIGACLYSDECSFSKDESALAGKIFANERAYSDATLQFADDSSVGGFSSVDGDSHRLMVTGLTPSSKILVNMKAVADLTVNDLIGIFAHELVHHTGIKDDALRIPDSFGTRIAVLAKRFEVPIDLGVTQTSAMFLNYPQPMEPSFPAQFPGGLFPTIYIEQSTETLIGENTMLRREERNICGVGQTLWSSSAIVTSVARASSDVTVYVQFRSRCFEPLKLQLQEVIYYGNLRIKFDPTTFSAGQMSISFSKSAIDPVATLYLDVNVTKFPTEVNAGDTITVEATVTSPTVIDAVSCSALVGSDAWRSSSSEALLTVQTDDCEILSKKDGTEFAIRFRVKIADHAADGLQLKLQAVGLKLRFGKYFRGQPARETNVRVKNARVVAAAISKITQTVTGSRVMDAVKFPASFLTPRGTPATYVLTVEQTTAQALFGFDIHYQAKMLDGSIMNGVATLDSLNASCANSTDQVLRCEFTVDLMKLAPGKEVVIWAPTELVVLTSEMQFAFKDVSVQQLSVIAFERK